MCGPKLNSCAIKYDTSVVASVIGGSNCATVDCSRITIQSEFITLVEIPRFQTISIGQLCSKKLWPCLRSTGADINPANGAAAITSIDANGSVMFIVSDAIPGPFPAGSRVVIQQTFARKCCRTKCKSKCSH